MTFYTDPAFFIFVAIAVVPAIVLGLREKPLRAYGFVVSLVLIALLFSKDLHGAVAFAFYLVLSFSITRWYQLRLKKNPTSRCAYPVALGLVLAPLVIYKIGAVFDTNLLGFLGISYITFKTVQVVIETHDGLIEKMTPVDYLYFLIFFPSFTSGPILRSRDFLSDITVKLSRSEYLDLLTRGVFRFLIGAFYKIVCSSVFSIAIWYIPKALGDETLALQVAGQVGSAYAYGFYLFFDFAGYSLMAMGVGAALGVRVPRNFKAPFLSIDFKDFWNRWHITLSFWLRDFVFMRLVRLIRAKKLISSRLVTACFGFVVNMTVMGLWHGLTLPYISYGLYHGLMLAATELFQKTACYKQYKDRRLFKVVSWFFTFNMVMLGFAIFSGQVFSG